MRGCRYILTVLLAGIIIMGLMGASHAQLAPFPPMEFKCKDRVDNDGDGRVDCRDSDCIKTFYRDADNDTWGAPATYVKACRRPTGYVPVGGDCDDTSALIYMGATETCSDGLDNECDGKMDCADEDCATDGVCVAAVSPATAEYFGMYVGDVKSSNAVNYDGDPDVANTLAALQATGQNLFGYGAHTEREWGHFRNFLAGAGGSGINFFAVLGERHQESTTSYLQNRWMKESLGYGYLRRSDISTDADANGYTDNFCFDTDGDADDSDPDTYETCYDQVSRDLHDIWLKGLKKAAETFSDLSLTYPELIAFTVDDFDGFPCFSDDGEGASDNWCYTRAEVAEITAAAHTHNAGFKFWPTMYFNTIGRLVAPGYTLGAKYWNDADGDGELIADGDYEVFGAGESAELTLTLTPPLTFTSANLSFFYEDSSMYVNGAYESSLAKKITVNGTDVSAAVGFNTDFSGDAYVEYLNGDFSAYLTPGVANTVKITLTSAGDARFGPYYLDVWDIAFSIDGADYSDSFTVTPTTTEYAPTYPYTLTAGLENASLIAASNAEYLVSGSDNAIDGILLTYQALDTFYAGSDGAEIYQRTLKSVKAALGEKDLIVNHYASLYGDADGDGVFEVNPATIGAASLMEQIYLDSAIADGVVVYSYPLGASGRDDPKTGIFAKRKNNADATAFDVMMHIPWWQPWVMGWYQSWTAPNLTGTVFLTLGEANGMTGFIKKVTDGDGNVLYREAASDDECALVAGDTCPGYGGGGGCTIESVDCSYDYNFKTELKLELGATSTDITVTLNTDAAANIFGMSLYAAIRDASGMAIAGLSGDVDADGFIDGYTFSSGIGEKNVISIFNNVSCAYRDIRGLDMGGDTLSDADGDGVNDGC